MKRQMNRETTDISEMLKNNNGDNKMYILTTLLHYSYNKYIRTHYYKMFELL